MLREILQPTRACREMVHEHFRPDFEHMQQILSQLLPDGTCPRTVRQVAFSLVGQCMFYRVAGEVVRMLVSEEEYDERYSIVALEEHIYHVLLAAVGKCRSVVAPPMASHANLKITN
jgi:hypothetical protein